MTINQHFIARLSEVDSLLTNAHTSGKFSLDLPLGQSLLPVVKALRYQESLWDLDLSSTKLDDHIFQVFSRYHPRQLFTNWFSFLEFVRGPHYTTPSSESEPRS